MMDQKSMFVSRTVRCQYQSKLVSLVFILNVLIRKKTSPSVRRHTNTSCHGARIWVILKWIMDLCLQGNYRVHTSVQMCARVFQSYVTVPLNASSMVILCFQTRPALLLHVNVFSIFSCRHKYENVAVLRQESRNKIINKLQLWGFSSTVTAAAIWP